MSELPSSDARQPAINLPPATAVLAGALLLIHGLRQLLSEQADDELISNLALVPARLVHWPLDWGAVASVFTHMLLHGGWLHLLVNTGMLLAFAAGLERLLGAPRMLLLALVSGVAGALVHVAVYAQDQSPMLGASGAISGLFGAMMTLIAQRQGNWRFLGGVSLLWIASNVGLGLSGIPSSGETMEIAWVAHLGGYLAGIAAIGIMRPWQRTRRTPWKR